MNEDAFETRPETAVRDIESIVGTKLATYLDLRDLGLRGEDVEIKLKALFLDIVPTLQEFDNHVSAVDQAEKKHLREYFFTYVFPLTRISLQVLAQNLENSQKISTIFHSTIQRLGITRTELLANEIGTRYLNGRLKQLYGIASIYDLLPQEQIVEKQAPIVLPKPDLRAQTPIPNPQLKLAPTNSSAGLTDQIAPLPAPVIQNPIQRLWSWVRRRAA